MMRTNEERVEGLSSQGTQHLRELVITTISFTFKMIKDSEDIFSCVAN